MTVKVVRGDGWDYVALRISDLLILPLTPDAARKLAVKLTRAADTLQEGKGT